MNLLNIAFVTLTPKLFLQHKYRVAFPLRLPWRAPCLTLEVWGHSISPEMAGERCTAENEARMVPKYSEPEPNPGNPDLFSLTNGSSSWTLGRSGISSVFQVKTCTADWVVFWTFSQPCRSHFKLGISCAFIASAGIFEENFVHVSLLCNSFVGILVPLEYHWPGLGLRTSSLPTDLILGQISVVLCQRMWQAWPFISDHKGPWWNLKQQVL